LKLSIFKKKYSFCRFSQQFLIKKIMKFTFWSKFGLNLHQLHFVLEEIFHGQEDIKYHFLAFYCQRHG
jgi:hypothetical protein